MIGPVRGKKRHLKMIGPVRGKKREERGERREERGEIEKGKRARVRELPSWRQRPSGG